MTKVFEKDLQSAVPYTLAMWKRRPLGEKLVEKLLRPIRSQL
jgi:cardiolipin synthase